MGFKGFELPHQNPCFFCEVVRNGQPHDFVCETDTLLVRVNGRQFLEGQCVVIPRRHAATVFDITDAELVAIAQTSRCVGKAIAKAVGADGLLIYQNNGVASGQEVPHYHLHVVPQWKADSPVGKFPPHIARAENLGFEKVRPIILNTGQIREMSARIRSHLEI